jgi:hypothetical protein
VQQGGCVSAVEQQAADCELVRQQVMCGAWLKLPTQGTDRAAAMAADGREQIA